MLRYILIGFGILTALLVLTFIGTFFYVKKKYAPGAEKVLAFIQENPDKASITWYRNDTLMASQHPDRKMPLASAMKIIVAIEYAHQAAAGVIDADQLIDTLDLEVYHVKNTDGGAHSSWLAYSKNGIQGDKVAIRDIAKGMISHSSNANTEWMCAALGLDNINRRIDSLGISSEHDEIYHLVSSLFIGKELYPALSDDSLKEKLIALDSSTYVQSTATIHEKLLQDKDYKLDKGDNSLKIQKVWSDRLPSATTAAYASVMKKLNSKTDFDPKVYEYLDEVMEIVMQNPRNAQWLKHSGSKGGSTGWVLAEALYATDKKGNRTELVYFLNDLSRLQSRSISKSMNEFNLKLLNNEDFRNTVKIALGQHGG